MKNEKLNEMDHQSLQDRLLEYKKKYFNLRFQKSLGELSNTSSIKKIKKDIARIYTYLNKINSKTKNNF